MRLNTVTLLIFFSMLAACVTVTPPSSQPTNYSYHYNPAISSLNPEFKIVSQSDNTVRLYVKLNTRELRFSKANPDVEYRAEIQIDYLVVPSFTDRTVVDSTTSEIKVRYNSSQTELVTFFEIKTDFLKDFIIYTRITDKYSKRQSRHFTRGANKEEDNHYHYLIRKLDGRPVFRPYINAGDTITISKLINSPDTFYVNYYGNDFKPAYAPFDTERSDSVYLEASETFKLPSHNWQAIFSPQKAGLYHIQTDTTLRGGKLLYVGRKDYPLFTMPEHLIGPLRYITRTPEYDTILYADNKKLEIDKFWLQTTNNKEKARQLLRIWYTRAMYANIFFTSYKEGWKTDRGMVYILFGPPDFLNYNDLGERWSYRIKTERAHEFQFVRENPNLLTTDYALKRSMRYTNYWYQAADSWRKGNIYE